jgi:hypothetical protein
MADAINTLLALDDAQLSAKLGYDKRLKDFKDNLSEANKLSGKAREKVVDRLDSMLNPKIYDDDLKWTVESAQRLQAKLDGKTSPESIVADAGCGCVD